MHTQAYPSSSPTLIEVDVPLLFGGPWRPLANRAELDVWLSCTDEPEEKCITSLIDWLCVCILWVQTPPPPHHAIDLAFNAQTNSSLIIPGYFLGPLLSQHNLLKGGKKAMWNELEKEFYLLNKSGKWFISVKWNCRWVVCLWALKIVFRIRACGVSKVAPWSCQLLLRLISWVIICTN